MIQGDDGSTEAYGVVMELAAHTILGWTPARDPCDPKGVDPAALLGRGVRVVEGVDPSRV